MNVQKCTLADLEGAATFADLLAEYAAEAAVAGLPAPSARMGLYRHLEAEGLMHFFSAVLDDRLVGFITVLDSTLPHYDVPVAVSESFFVAKAARNTMAGLKLLTVAEELAHVLGSPGLLVSAPFEGKLFELLPRLGYTETNRVFFKRVGVPAVRRQRIAAMSEQAIDRVRLFEGQIAQLPQLTIQTDHMLHAGLYIRTVHLPAGGSFTGALVKVPTILAVDGDVLIYTGDDVPLHVEGYRELQASAGRKQAFVTRKPTRLTMMFATTAQTVEEAEAEFTDETDLLLSRRNGDSGHGSVTACPA